MKVNLGKLAISSPAFAHGARIPQKYSSEGEGISPPLEWSEVPEGTVSFALVCDDPDAPLITGFCHWVLYGIPGDVRGLPENAGDVYTAGGNGMGDPIWVPPSPPPGHGDHYYYFHLYALDADLGLEPGLGKDELLARIDPHVIEQARIVGSYSTGG